MSRGLNRCEFIGNLCADAELRRTGSGTPVCSFRLACSEKYKDRDGQPQEKTEFVTCVLWGTRAEALAQYLSRGKPVWVEGKMETSEYEKDGQRRWKTEVNVRDLILLGSRSGDSPHTGQSVSSGSPWAAPAPADDQPPF